MSALITREPKQDLKLTKSQLLRQKLRFGHVSVTLSNAGYAKKCVGNYCTVFIGNAERLWLDGLFSANNRLWSKGLKTLCRWFDSASGHQETLKPPSGSFLFANSNEACSQKSRFSMSNGHNYCNNL